MPDWINNIIWGAILSIGAVLAVWAYILVTTKPARHDDEHPYGDASTYGRRTDQ